MKKRKINIQQLLSFLLLMLTLGIVLYIGLTSTDLNDVANALQSLTPACILILLASWVLYVLFNALSMLHFLHVQGYSIKLWQALHAVFSFLITLGLGWLIL